MTRRRAPAVDHSRSIYATATGVVGDALTWLGLLILVMLPLMIFVHYPWTIAVVLFVWAVWMFTRKRR